MRTSVIGSINTWRMIGVVLGAAAIGLVWQGPIVGSWASGSDGALTDTLSSFRGTGADRAEPEPGVSQLSAQHTVVDESSTGDTVAPEATFEPEVSIEPDVMIVSGPEVYSPQSSASLRISPTNTPPPNAPLSWSPIWRPFLSERTASGFAEYIGEATGLTLRVGEPDEAGRYEVEVEHRSDAEHLAAIERIVQATGYRPAER